MNEEPATNVRLAQIKPGFRHSHEVMSEVCAFAYNFGCGIVLRKSVLQRCYRDADAGLRRILHSGQIMQDCGNILTGHVPNGARTQLPGLH